MIDKEKIKHESAMVKALGDAIGYGHLMSLASAHWRKMLKERGFPESGAFIATIEMMIKEEHRAPIKESNDLYDKLIAD